MKKEDYTLFLLILIATMVVKMAYPTLSEIANGIVVSLVVSGGVIWISEKRKLKKETKELNAKFNEFWIKHKSIRDKYDPSNAWNESTSLPADYLEEMRILNEEYGPSLEARRNRNR
jgi:hypothetical protein